MIHLSFIIIFVFVHERHALILSIALVAHHFIRVLIQRRLPLNSFICMFGCTQSVVSVAALVVVHYRANRQCCKNNFTWDPLPMLLFSGTLTDLLTTVGIGAMTQSFRLKHYNENYHRIQSQVLHHKNPAQG